MRPIMMHTYQPSNVHIQQSQVIHQQIIQPMTQKSQMNQINDLVQWYSSINKYIVYFFF